MSQYRTESGISCVGPLRWGSHLCYFYDEIGDLIDILVPYFKKGLEKGECCVWVCTPPLRPEDAEAALRSAVPDLGERIKRAQIQIVDYWDWYVRDGVVDGDRISAQWVAEMEKGLARGYEGLRASGNAFWIENTRRYKDFLDYESRLNQKIKNHQLVALCGYDFPRSTARDVLNVVHCHDFTIACQHGKWEVVETATLKIAKEQLRRANEELESRVAERTGHLERALAEKEVLLDSLRESDARIRRLVDSNIIGIIIWTLDGKIVEANAAFLAMVGYSREDLLSGQVSWAGMTPREWHDADQLAVDQIRDAGSCKPFEKEYTRKDGSRVPVLVGAASFKGTREEGVAFVLDLSERKEADKRQLLLLEELNHRVKNTLATVKALSGQTLRTASSPEAFSEAFEGRLVALSKTHNLLNRSCWSGVSLRDILMQELAPYGSAEIGRFLLDGDDIRLGPVAAITLGMAFHELTTNAAKYGALSVPCGCVRVAWRQGAPGRLHLDWREAGGPRVRPPQRRGFGSSLIEEALAGEVCGEVRLDFLAQGLHCVMDILLEQVSAH